MISNTLTAAQHHEVFTHLLALVAILGAIIIAMGITLVKMWVRKDSIRSFEARHAHLEDDFMQLQARLRNADTSLMSTMRTAEHERQEMGTIISNLRAQLRRAQSLGSHIKQVSFDTRFGKSHRYMCNTNVERIVLKETDTVVTIVQHLKNGQGVLHVEHQRTDIKGPILKVFTELDS